MRWTALLVPVVLGSALHGGLVGCDSVALEPPDESVAATEQPLSWGGFPASGPTTTSTPIGLAIEIDNGEGVPLQVRQGQRFYMNQLDMRASLDETTIDEGVDGLDDAGDFAALDWDDTELVDQSFVGQPNADGTFTRRRFYRQSKWMDQPSVFVIEQVDPNGHITAVPIVIGTGLEYQRFPFDSFFTRRLRAIQYANDCASPSDCSGATSFSEEALVELRYSNGSQPNFEVQSNTAALKVFWSLKPFSPYTIPVTQIATPQWDYGFSIDLAPITPPAADGTYSPGQQIAFQFTLRDGSGKRLHDPGVMPSYADFLAGNVESGIQYWRNQAEPYATYYRRKHREKQMQLAVMGPEQNLGPIHDVLDIFSSIDFASGVVTASTQTNGGFYAGATGIPSYLVLFGPPETWTLPSTDTWTFTIPPDSAPGTYFAAMKARRTYLGEDTPQGKVIEFQVGTTTHTHETLETGHCNDCHASGSGSDFKRILHGIDNRAACTTCHAPLDFELEGPVYVREHFIHSRSDRFDAPLTSCSTCHLTQGSIERTSKSACLSCHKSYPADHVASYGPVTDMYVGGGAESFGQCSTTCHTNHPGSGL